MGVKRPGRRIDHTSPSSAVVKGRVTAMSLLPPPPGLHGLITIRQDSRCQKFLQDQKTTHGHDALSQKHLNLLQHRR